MRQLADPGRGANEAIGQRIAAAMRGGGVKGAEVVELQKGNPSRVGGK